MKLITTNENLHQSTLKIVLLSLNANLGSFFFGYCLGVLNMALPTLYIVLNIQESQGFWSGFISASMGVGALIGCSLSAFLLKILSRKKSLIFIDLLGIAGSLLSIIATLPTFCIHRFLVGIATGLNSSIVSLYVREFSPISISGGTGSLNGIIIFVGVVTSYMFGLGFDKIPSEMTNNNNYFYWRFVFLFPIFTCLLRIILLKTIFIYESPLYYMKKNKIAKAENIIKLIYKDIYVA